MNHSKLRPPPWGDYEQVQDAPYPMTTQEHYRWLREPGYKYELHAGMCVRKWRGPLAYHRGYGILLAFQPVEHRWDMVVPALSGCETSCVTEANWWGVEALQIAIDQGKQAIDEWCQKAKTQSLPLPEPELSTDEQITWDRHQLRIKEAIKQAGREETE